MNLLVKEKEKRSCEWTGDGWGWKHNWSCWELDGKGEYWKRWLERGEHFIFGQKNLYKEFSQESTWMTPTNTPRNSACVSETDHFMWSGKTSSGRIGKLTIHIIFVLPDYGMCWGSSDSEIVEVTNQLLVKPETYAMRVSWPLILPGVLGPRESLALKPRIEPNMVGEKIIFLTSR